MNTREYTNEALDPSNDVISLPKVFTMFIPILETLLTKILNPQVSPFCEPQVSSFSSPSKCCRIYLNTSHTSPKSCHDFDQSRHDCLWTIVVTSPFQVNLVRKLLNRVTISQIMSQFSISRTNLFVNPIVSRCPESWHDFRIFQNSQFEANIQHLIYIIRSD